MSIKAIEEQLDQAVEKILSGEPIEPERIRPPRQELLPIANDLHLIPRSDFRAALLANWSNLNLPGLSPSADLTVPFSQRSSRQSCENYPVHRSNFVVSAALHAVATALLLTSSLWLAQRKNEVRLQSINLVSNSASIYIPRSARSRRTAVEEVAITTNSPSRRATRRASPAPR